MRSPYVLVILGLLASIDLLAQCENSQTPAQAATCLQNLLKTKADQKYLDDNFTKKTDVTTTLKGYATKTDVENTCAAMRRTKTNPRTRKSTKVTSKNPT